MFNIQTTFEILHINEKADSIIVRSYSPLFKNSKDSYTPFNITLSYLNQTESLSSQIMSICNEYVKKTLLKESDDYNTAIEELEKQERIVTTTYELVTSAPINFIV